MRLQGISGPVRKHEGASSAFFPRQTARDVTVVSLVLLALLIMAWRGAPPLEGPADPTDARFIPRPEWYFLGLFQLLKYFPGKLEVVGAIVHPDAARCAARAPAVARSRPRARSAPPPRRHARRRDRRPGHRRADDAGVARSAGVGGWNLVDAGGGRAAARRRREVRAVPLGQWHGGPAGGGVDVQGTRVAGRPRRRRRDDRAGPARAADGGDRARGGGARRLRAAAVAPALPWLPGGNRTRRGRLGALLRRLPCRRRRRRRRRGPS